MEEQRQTCVIEYPYWDFLLFYVTLLQDLKYVVLKVNCISIILMNTLLIVECQLVLFKVDFI